MFVAAGFQKRESHSCDRTLARSAGTAVKPYTSGECACHTTISRSHAGTAHAWLSLSDQDFRRLMLAAGRDFGECFRVPAASKLFRRRAYDMRGRASARARLACLGRSLKAAALMQQTFNRSALPSAFLSFQAKKIHHRR
jgi:hypothetical protein